MSQIVVIGAGQAGSSLVVKLRNEGFEGQITLIGEETAPPYQRPPLSKKYLMGEMALERLYLRPMAYYAENNIELVLSTAAVSIDRATKSVAVGDREIPYDQLALTTGSVPRRLPASIGGALGGVYVVRGLADVDAMAPNVAAGKHVLIVGGGYIGLEAASVCSKMGMQVTLVEMADRILQRVACAQTSDYFRALHLSHGVDIREGVGLDHLTGDGQVSGAVLSDGSEVALDMVIVGVGITPADTLATEAGLAIENGIKTDAFGRTSDPAIWSAGDCASFVYKGNRIRLESVQNAIDQAECVAKNMMGAEREYLPYPWFWSDQYDTKLQIAGLNTGYDRVIARAGDGPSVSHWYYAGDRFLAVDAMNDPRAYMVGKRLLEAGKSPAATAVSDPALDLKTLLRG